MKAFFPPVLLLIDPHVSITNLRYAISGFHYLWEAMGGTTEGLCILWEVLRAGRPHQVYLDEGNPDHHWNMFKPNWCSRGSWDVCCKLLSLQSCLLCLSCSTASLQASMSWCSMHPVEELGSVPSSCSAKAVPGSLNCLTKHTAYTNCVFERYLQKGEGIFSSKLGLLEQAYIKTTGQLTSWQLLFLDGPYISKVTWMQKTESDFYKLIIY